MAVLEVRRVSNLLLVSSLLFSDFDPFTSLLTIV